MQTSLLISQLTPMESVVVDFVLSGRANKNIASDLILSQRTIEAHRANVFQKMRVRNALELIGLLAITTEAPVQGRHMGPVWFSSS